jgi:lipoprotein-releasing system permease protein
MADFVGHISVKSTKSNSSYNSSVLHQEGLNVKGIQNLPDVSNTQSYATVSGILRTEENFAGSYSKRCCQRF